MSILPAIVESIVTENLQLLLYWFSEHVYAKLLLHADGHFLVRLHRRLDCTPLEEACRAFHHQSGPGSPAIHAVSKLARALLLSYLFNWSLRQLEIELRFNLLVKWFAGYTLFDKGPDHTTLDRFELWVCLRQPRTFFDSVLEQIDQDFPNERRQIQVGDTFALRADASKEELVPMIRHSCQCLLRILVAVAPQLQPAIETWLEQTELFGTSDESSEYHLTQFERAQRLQATVRAAQRCAQWVARELDALTAISDRARNSVQEWLTRLEKIWNDEIVVTADEQGQLTIVNELKDKGSYRLGSATDPDATYRVHGEKKTDFGYNVQLVVTDNFIREIQADTGAQPDHVSIPAVLQAQQEHHDLVPAKFIYDAAAGNGKTRALVAEATDGQTLLVAPLIHHSTAAILRDENGQELFKPDRFTLSDDGLTLTCPNGQTADAGFRAKANGDRGEGRTFRFRAVKCKDCPFWNACRGPASKPNSIRHVLISDYRSYIEAAQLYNQTDAFKAEMKIRPCVERIVAALVRYNGARRARRRGQLKADFQMKMAATAFNLKKWMHLLTPQLATPAQIFHLMPRPESAW